MGHSSRCDGFGTRSPATAAWLKDEPSPYKESRAAICRLQLSAVPAKLVSAVKEWQGAGNKNNAHTLPFRPALSDPISTLNLIGAKSTPLLTGRSFFLHTNLWHCVNKTIALSSLHSDTEVFRSITTKAAVRERPLSSYATRHSEHLAQLTSAQSLQFNRSQ